MNLFILLYDYKCKVRQVVADSRSLREVEAVLDYYNIEYKVQDLFGSTLRRTNNNQFIPSELTDKTVYRLVWYSDSTYEILSTKSTLLQLVNHFKLASLYKVFDLKEDRVNLFE